VSAAAQVVNGMTYRKLRPEVKQTLEKIVYQLELVGKTLQLMEQRVMDSEDKLQEVMTFIKTSDLDYVSSLTIRIYCSILSLFCHLATTTREQGHEHEQV